MSNGTSVNPVGTANLNSCLFSHNGVSDEQEAMEEEG